MLYLLTVLYPAYHILPISLSIIIMMILIIFIIFIISLYFFLLDENAQLRGKYEELKDEMKKLNQDFEYLYRIGGLIASLSRPYEVSIL